jgi:hypothetical protein
MSDDGEPIGEAEDTKLYIADPDDYARTRKLKALSDAKGHVRKLRNDMPTTANKREWNGIHARLAEAVASYGHELLPLLEEAEDNGIIGDGDFYTNTGHKRDVRNLIYTDGRVGDPAEEEVGVPAPHESMAIFRHLQKLERKLGLGLELEEQTDDEWAIQT